MVLVSEEAHLTAVLAKIRAGGANAFGLGELKGMTTLPAYYVEVHVSEIFAPLTRGETPDVRLWRITTKAVAQSYTNAQRQRAKTAAALEGQSVTVEDVASTRITRDQSDDPIGPDGDRLSGVSMWRYAL